MLTVTSFPDVGKSHLAAAVGHELILPVLWATTAALVQRLLAAKRDLRLPSELAKLDHVACLILDDMGYVQHDRDEMEVLFTLLAERYERRSVIPTTNPANPVDVKHLALQSQPDMRNRHLRGHSSPESSWRRSGPCSVNTA
jgi:chromosomal replication initiation ATPase DnaA